MAASLGDTCELLAVLTADAAAADTLSIGGTETGFEVLSLPYDDRLQATGK